MLHIPTQNDRRHENDLRRISGGFATVLHIGVVKVDVPENTIRHVQRTEIMLTVRVIPVIDPDHTPN